MSHFFFLQLFCMNQDPNNFHCDWFLCQLSFNLWVLLLSPFSCCLLRKPSWLFCSFQESRFCCLSLWCRWTCSCLCISSSKLLTGSIDLMRLRFIVFWQDHFIGGMSFHKKTPNAYFVILVAIDGRYIDSLIFSVLQNGGSKSHSLFIFLARILP